MTFGSRLRRAVAATALVATAVGVGAPPGARAQTCGEVVSFARATATVGRVDLRSGAGLAAPATISNLLFDSIPTVSYNQSGPTSLGQLEDPTGTNPNTLAPTAWGFSPVDMPVGAPAELFGPNPPFLPAAPYDEGRAEAAFPILQGIPQDSENSFGPAQSEAHAYPTYSSGRASSSGIGGADGAVRKGSAFTNSVLECETLTLIVGWEASGVVTAGGTIPSMSQIATLVVSPEGASVDVATNVAEETEEGVPVIEGRTLDPVTDPFNEQGTYLDIGEPRIEIEDGRARVWGGGIRYGTADPSRNDTYTFYTIGSLEGLVEFVSVLPPPTEGDGDAGPTAPPPATGGGRGGPVDGQTTTVVTESSGTPPRPSAAAEDFAAAQIQLAGITEDLTTGSTSLWPLLLASLALAIIGRTAWFAADRSRERFPTAGFAVDWFRVRGQRFSATYLEW